MSLETFYSQQKEIWEEYEFLLKESKKDLAATKKLRDLYPTIAGHYAFLLRNHSESPQTKKLKEYLQNSWKFLDAPVGEAKLGVAFHILAFYVSTLPHQIYQHKKFFLASILLFWLSVFFSFVITVNVPEFGSAFLGSSQYHYYRSQVEAGIKFQNFFVPEYQGSVVFIKVFLNNFSVSLLALLGWYVNGYRHFICAFKKFIFSGWAFRNLLPE